MIKEDIVTAGREADLRREVARLGYELRRSPVSDPAHPACGHYMIVDKPQHVVVAGYEPFAYSLDLDGVADWLKSVEPTH
jgi:hypothetical protein